jgi:thiamine kinase
MTPEAALRRARPAWRGARIERGLHVAPLKTSHLVRRGTARYVMRIDTAPHAPLGLDRAREFAILGLAARAGIAPEPIALVPGACAVLVTRYVPGRAWGREELSTPACLTRLAALLRVLHALPVEAGAGPALDLAAVGGRYARLAGSAAARRLAERARRAQARAGLGEGPAVLCHHDPIGANVVGRRSPRLIDWEYAAPGDPLLDLAVVIGHERLPLRLARHFLGAYYGDPRAVPWPRVRAAVAYYGVLERLWRLALAGAARPAICQWD